MLSYPRDSGAQAHDLSALHFKFGKSVFEDDTDDEDMKAACVMFEKNLQA